MKATSCRKIPTPLLVSTQSTDTFLIILKGLIQTKCLRSMLKENSKSEIINQRNSKNKRKKDSGLSNKKQIDS